MNDRGRIALIFATVAVAGIGGGYYFVEIYRPKQVADDARAEVGRWEARFDAARACLLGPKPGSSKTSEALALRELAPDLWESGNCTPLISKLNRGEEPDTGLTDVENAWVEIDHAASATASAFGTHVGAMSLDHDPLPDALDRLDGARAKLRAAAGMPPAALPGKPLVAATIVPIVDGTEQLASLELASVPSAHGIVMYGKTASRTVQVVAVAGGAVQVGRVGPDSLRAVPDTSWGASPGAAGFRVGAFDREGAMPSPQDLQPAGTTTVAAVLGTLADGIVVHGNDKQLAITHVRGDAIVADPPIAIATAMAATDPDGRALVTWVAGKASYGRIVGFGHDEPAVALAGATTTTNSCLSSDRGWLAMGRHGVTAISSGKSAMTYFPPDASQLGVGILQGCTAEGALLRGTGDQLEEGAAAARSFTICTTSCRTAKLPTGAPDLSAATIVGGKLVAIESHGDVIGVWREGAAPVFYSLPQFVRPVVGSTSLSITQWAAMALTDGKMIDVIAHGDKGFVVVRLPATAGS